MLDPAAAARMTGDVVVDDDGREVGRVVEVYLADDSRLPAWAVVDTGPTGGHRTAVPLADAEFMGNRLRIPHRKAVVDAAPRLDADQGRLLPAQAAALADHYGIDTAASRRPGDAAGTTAAALTRSAEQLRVSTEWVGTERVRLRKVIVTEQVTVTVPVSHEEIRVEREPLDAETTDGPMSAPAEPGTQHEIVLHAQRPVVTTEVVPVERVRVSTAVVSGQTTVTESLREERIEADTDLAPGADHR